MDKIKKYLRNKPKYDFKIKCILKIKSSKYGVKIYKEYNKLCLLIDMEYSLYASIVLKMVVYGVNLLCKYWCAI